MSRPLPHHATERERQTRRRTSERDEFEREREAAIRKISTDTETEFLMDTAEHAATRRTSQRVPQARHRPNTRLEASLCNVARCADAGHAVMILDNDTWTREAFSE